VFLDGNPATVEQVNGDFLGCIVPAGARDVRFLFDPLSLRIGKAISLAGLGACVLLLVAAFAQRRFQR
jgi:uncharacterized membrane protein YfhO